MTATAAIGTVPRAHGDIVYFGSPYLLQLSLKHDQAVAIRQQAVIRRQNELQKQSRKLRQALRKAKTPKEQEALSRKFTELRKAISEIGASLAPRTAGKSGRASLRRQFESDLRRLREKSPDISRQEAVLRLAYPGSAKIIRDMIEAQRPAPLLFSDLGFYFHGTVVNHFKGTRRSRNDPASFDQMAFRAFGPGGKQRSVAAARLSSRYMLLVEHEYDTARDFVWRFSNRHRLLKVPFGSARHRQAIFGLFDPEGEMGLAGEPAPDFGEKLREGTITRFLTDGPPSKEQQRRLFQWTRTAPDGFAHRLQNVEKFRSYKIPELRSAPLFLTMARAGKYDVVTPEVARLADQAASILCTMALADPGVALGPAQKIAIRARRLGATCYENIQEILAPAFDSPGHGVGQISWFFRLGALPVEPSAVQRTVLDFVLRDEAFTQYVGANYVPQSAGEPAPNPGSLPTESLRLTAMLADIAMGNRPAHAGTERQKLATRALERMITPAAAGNADEADYSEWQARAFRQALFHWAGKNYNSALPRTQVDRSDAAEIEALRRARYDWVRRMFCRVGWGHSADSIGYGRRVLGRAYKLLEKAHYGEDLSPADQHELERNFRRAGQILKTADPNKEQERKLLDDLNERLDDLKRRSNKAKKAKEKAFYKEFFDKLNAYRKQGDRCA